MVLCRAAFFYLRITMPINAVLRNLVRLPFCTSCDTALRCQQNFLNINHWHHLVNDNGNNDTTASTGSTASTITTRDGNRNHEGGSRCVRISSPFNLYVFFFYFFFYITFLTILSRLRATNTTISP